MNASSLTERLPRALLVLRITLAIFLLQWAIEKFVNPDVAASIFGHFYGIADLSVTASYVLGAAQTLLALALLVGYQRHITYGIALIIHFISTASTWRYLLNPYEEINHLFIAAVPVVAAFWALYYLRDWDSHSLDAQRLSPASE